MGEDVYTWIVGLAREYGREWANFNAPEDMWKWIAERVEGRLAEAWDEGYAQGVEDESDHEHGVDHGCPPLQFTPEGQMVEGLRCTPNPYSRSEGGNTDQTQAEVPGRAAGEEDPV